MPVPKVSVLERVDCIVKKPKNFTCTAARMIKCVVTFAFANVQQTKALVLECCRVG